MRFNIRLPILTDVRISEAKAIMKTVNKTAQFRLSFANKQQVTIGTDEVIWLLKKSDHTITSIAERIGFSRGQVSACINGRELSPEVRKALIPLLEKLWIRAGKKSPQSPLLSLSKHAG